MVASVETLEAGEKVRITTVVGKVVYLELISTPSNANVLNGVSGEDQYLVKGYLLTKNLQYSQKTKQRKLFIVNERDIEIIK